MAQAHRDPKLRARLQELIYRFQGKRVLVLGDVMLDEHLWGQVTRISPEAPIPVVDVQRATFVPGGAANVAANIAALGGQAVLVSIVGDDDAGQRLRSELASRGVEVRFLPDPSRPTTVKTRIIAHSQQVVRVDRESREPLTEQQSGKLLHEVEKAFDSTDALLISDYAKGVTTPGLLSKVIDLGRAKGKSVLVGPKGRNYDKYRGATMVIPNRSEAEEATGCSTKGLEGILAAGRELLSRLDCRAILITRGEDGMSLFESVDDVSHFPTAAREVHDGTGAGDTVVSTLALALAGGGSFKDAARAANYAAGIVVGKVGVATAGPAELEATILEDLG